MENCTMWAKTKFQMHPLIKDLQDGTTEHLQQFREHQSLQPTGLLIKTVGLMETGLLVMLIQVKQEQARFAQHGQLARILFTISVTISAIEINLLTLI